MTRAILLTLAVALLLQAPPSRHKPSATGYIVVGGNTCDEIAATDLDVDISNPSVKSVTWTLLTDCSPSATTVTVGVFTAAGKFYPLLTQCGTTTVQDKNTIVCTLNAACGKVADAFTYDVCVDGLSIYDPELRIKGTRQGPPDCAEITEVEARRNCKKPTRPTGRPEASKAPKPRP